MLHKVERENYLSREICAGIEKKIKVKWDLKGFCWFSLKFVQVLAKRKTLETVELKWCRKNLYSLYFSILFEFEESSTTFENIDTHKVLNSNFRCNYYHLIFSKQKHA